MIEQECDHGSDPATCPVCLGPARPPVPPAPPSRPFHARYPGRCGVCHEPIDEDDLIRMADQYGGPIHDACPPNSPR
jgi:hypothetical protein